jgi:hypothetical protein
MAVLLAAYKPNLSQTIAFYLDGSTFSSIQTKFESNYCLFDGI